MSRPATLFFAYCQAEYPLDAYGQPDIEGISNREIGTKFRQEIERLAGDDIKVESTEDPMTSRISDDVKQKIDNADAVVCVFPKRVKCPYHGWTTSQYVISESGYAVCRFRHDAEKRLFGFVEDGVDSGRLGIAFPNDRTLHRFFRDRIEEVFPKLKEIVASLLQVQRESSDKPEALLLHKTVYVRRDGRAVIESRYRFRVQRDAKKFRMDHTLWRVRSPLPNFQEMYDATPRDDGDYFRCLLRSYGSWEAREHDEELLVPLHRPPLLDGKEVPFTVEINKPARAGDIVEYITVCSYDNAFFDPSELTSWEKNSTGIRTGERGPVRDAILSVLFERNWNRGELLPSVELRNEATGPALDRSRATNPPALDRLQFWHRTDEAWEPIGYMLPNKDQHSAAPRYAIYEARFRNFSGCIKASWSPHMNFHQRRPSASRRSTTGPGDESSRVA